MRDIFIVCNNIDELGGLTRWAHHMGGLFTERGHRVHLVGITHADESRRHDSGAELPYSTTVLHQTHPPTPRGWGVPGRVRRLRRRATIRSGAARLSALFRSAAPGAVVIAAQVWAMEWVTVADTAGLDVVGMSHESYTATRHSSRYGRVKKYYADVDRLLLLTAEDADAWACDGMSNADHLPNPLHVTPSKVSPLTDKVVVHLGRLSFEKGQDMLLESWSLLTERHPDWTLRIYGAGPYADDLRRQAAELGLATVEFAGSTSDVAAALTNASIFALPSRQEGFPMSILESMAYGLPTVAFDCAPGVRELLTHESDGLVIRPGNTIAFAEALHQLMDQPDLRTKYGQAAQTSVQRFSAEVILDRWERLFAMLGR
jgi:glycosyltransferase involved in cell wall biosynthesis